MEKVKTLIVGCGLSGIVIARKLAESGEKVLIIEQRNHIGGNCYDYKQSNINVQKYGAHIFHTNYEEVWQFLSLYTEWHPYMHTVKAVIDGIETKIPFNLDSLHQVFPKSLATKLEEKLIETFGFNKKVPILELRKTKNKDLEFLANYIYQKVFLGYTVKQWGMNPEELDPSVSGRIPVYVSRDDRYFQDKYQAIPANGYTAMMQNILNHPNIEVRLNADFKDLKDKISYQRLIYSGAIDEYFNYQLGALPYRSLNFKYKQIDKEYYQNCSVINYPENYDYTRIVEYKYYLNDESDKTIISFEYPEDFEAGKNERYYPIPKDGSHALYQKYLEKAKQLPNVYFVGRLGDYKYYNMDETVLRALQLAQQLLNKDEQKNG